MQAAGYRAGESRGMLGRDGGWSSMTRCSATSRRLTRRELGAWGEEAACGYLTGQGFQVLDRNWRCPYGEVDIVAREGASLVFCEVRTRSGRHRGTPLESVTTAKVNRMALVAQMWLTRFGPHTGPIRCDVLGLLSDPCGELQITHVRGVQT